MLAAFVLSQLAALPDALLALWLMLLGKGVLDEPAGPGPRRPPSASACRRPRPGSCARSAPACSGASATRSRSRSNRTSRGCRRRFATIAHHERPDYLDRLAMLRDQVFVLDHMYMSVFSTCGWILRLGVTVALLASIHPALVLLAVFALPTVLTSTWRPAVERAAQERAAQANRLARHLFTIATTAPPGQGSAGHRHRRSPDDAAPRGVGARLRAGRGGAVGLGRVAHAGVGGLRRRLRRRGGLRVVGARRSRRRRPARARRGIAAVGVHRRHGRRDRIPARLLDGRLAAARLARGLRGRRSRHRPISPRPPRCGAAFASMHVSFAYPGTSRLVLDDVSLSLPAGAGRRHRRRERRRARPRSSSCWRKMYEPTSGSIFVDDTPLARMPADEWRSRLAGAFQDFFRFEFRARQTVGLGDVPRMDDRAGGRRPRSSAPAPRDVVARLPSGLDTQLGPTWPGGVEVSFGQWQKLALARGFMRDRPLLLVLDEPTAALDAETEHALFERYAAAARGDNPRRPHHAPRLAPLLDRPHGRSHRRPRRRARRRGRHARRADGEGGQYAELYGIQARAYQSGSHGS